MLENDLVPEAWPVLLAMDTATDRVHLALHDGARVHSVSLPGGAQASSTLLPSMQQLLADHGRAWGEVQALACGLGPGAFTGLRTACSVAQGLALGLACPVMGLDTLMAVAEDARQRHPARVAAGQRVWVLQDARMAELYVAAYEWDGQRWHEVVPAALWPQDEPARRWAVATADGPGLVLVGSGLAVWPESLSPTLLARGAHLDDLAVPSGAALIALAGEAWRRDQTTDAALLLPRYVRDKVAQTTAERLQSRQATA